ncbi:MAG: DUF1223 domain-containing protein [Gammaproteobacteria bacterium]
MKTIILMLAVWFSLIAYVQAEPQTFTSTDKRVNLVELYTSEGCSSCPPAEAWMGKLKNDDRLWKEFIPVAFHVDYWNYIGWPDRFASPQYSQRQRSYAAGNNLSTVYTPGVMLNGKEWRSLRDKQALDQDQSSMVGKLEVGVDTDHVMADFMTTENDKPAFLNVAILGFDLITKVKAGENHGKELEHDFVVLGYKRVAMKGAENGYALTTKLPMMVEAAAKTGLAVWVDYGRDLMPVQATGGWLASR